MHIVVFSLSGAVEGSVFSFPTLQATEQFASDVLREALAVAYSKSPQNRSGFSSLVFPSETGTLTACFTYTCVNPCSEVLSCFKYRTSLHSF